MKKQLAIFDMDETLISSDFTWALAPSRFMQRRGLEYEPTLDSAFYEYGVSKVIKILQNEYNLNIPSRDLFGYLTEETLDDYRYNVSLKEFAGEVVEMFRAAGFFTCVLSANSPLVLDIVKNRFSSELKMDGWFSTRNMPWSKGDERTFDLVASFFGLKSSDCVLLDDAEYAIETAEKIGIPFVRLENKHNYNSCSSEKLSYSSFKTALPFIKEIICR